MAVEPPAPARSRRRGLRLRTRLFLLVLFSSLLPAVFVLVIGWLQLRRQVSLWTLPSVERALDASLQANRRALDRLQRHLETEGRILAESSLFPLAPADTTGLSDLLDSGCREFGIDLAQFYAAEAGRFRLIASRTPSGAGGPDGSGVLRRPVPSAVGPQRPRSIRIIPDAADHLAVPTFLWEPAAEGDSVRLRGALVLGVALGPGFYDRILEVSNGLSLYRRLREMGLLLQTGYGLLALIALALGFGVSFWVARRVAGSVSRPVDALIRDMDTVGREAPASPDESGRRPPDAERPSSIPEMARLSAAFASMRRTLLTYESRLRESERVRGAQETARFVAHEIRNTLTPVRASLSVLEAQLQELAQEGRPRAHRALELIRREADRMAALAGAFSEYARFPERNPARLDLGLLVEEIARSEVPERIALHVERPPDLPHVTADREEMERVFRNLVKNAVESMPEAGSLRVSFTAAEDGLEVTLEDTGCGMNEETLRKALQPGFTTKETGTGLGLALVRRSLSHYGGIIRIESRFGEGTRCRIRMPASADREGET